jgi:lantibiotic modifying enzyme
LVKADLENAMFLDEAFSLGHRLSGAAIRHAGRCTWLGDDIVAANGVWRQTAGTLAPDFGTGTAGVGWFLARLSAATQDQAMATIAAEALRQSIQGADGLLANRRLGFHEGATGLAWAAVDGGRALGCAELVDHGIRVGLLAAQAATAEPDSADSPGLWRGSAGILAGLLGLADLSGEREFLNAASRSADRLNELISRWSSSSNPTSPVPSGESRSAVGLAEGASGVGVTLAAWSDRTGEQLARKAAAEAFRIERAWCSSAMGWYGAPAHAWADEVMVARSLCSGAAGIGIARLGAYVVMAAPNLLAEAGAAIDLIRRVPMRPDASDTSLCHGTAGEIELLITASTTLSESSHLDAARRLGARVVAAAQARRDYGSGLGESCQSPSLLFGLAGTGLVLLRLHDPALAPGGALPALIA